MGQVLPQCLPWIRRDSIVDKLKEKTAELEKAFQEDNTQHIKEELGDLLFVIANLARKAGIDAESALIHTNAKFDRRFRHIETKLKENGKDIQDTHLDEMEYWWTDAKIQEKQQD